MSDPLLFTSPPDEGGWSRPRALFLLISAALLILLLFSVREVLLPFALAITIAYVLNPLVAWVERVLRFPRGLAVASTYVVVLCLTVLTVLWISPRIYAETFRFAREAPSMIRELAERHGPAVDQKVNEYLGSQMHHPPQGTDQPAFVVRTAPDGSLHVDVGRGVEVVRDSDNRFRIKAHEVVPPGGFHLAELVSQGLEGFVTYLERNAIEVLKFGRALVGGAARAILLFFMVLMVAGYLTHTRRQIFSYFQALVPPRYRSDWDLLLRRVDRGFSGVVRGQLAICVVNGVLSALGFWLFGLKYWPVLSLLAGVLSIIPVFGAILSSIPAVAIGLTQSLPTAFWVLAWIILIHQIEANILNPKIIGAAAKIHPALVVFSLLVGEHYFGLWGALLAVPVLSLVQSVFNHFRYVCLPDSGPDSMSAVELARVTRRRLD